MDKDQSANERSAGEPTAMQGLFGPQQVIPLIDNLLAPSLINVVVMGFGAIIEGMISGITQNDGRTFPEPEELRSTRLFCEYCREIRDTPEGRRRCEVSNIAGVKLMLEHPLTDEERATITPFDSPVEGVTCYLCHAGKLEMVAPIRLQLGREKARWTKCIGAFWGGQCSIKKPEDIAQTLRELHKITSIPRTRLKSTYQMTKLLDTKAIRQTAGAVCEMAQALSESLDGAYLLREDERANWVIGNFTNEMTSLLTDASRPGKAVVSEETTRRRLTYPMKGFIDRYKLDCSIIYRVSPDEENDEGCLLIPFISYPRPEHNVIHLNMAPTDLVPRRSASRVVSGEQLAANPIAKKIASAWRADAERVGVSLYSFRSDRTGGYIWATIEGSGGRWQIGDAGVQAKFYDVCHYTAFRLEACLDILALLTTLQSKQVELKKVGDHLLRQKARAEVLVVRMAHLISRPILELKLASDLLYNDPYSKEMRDHFDSCLFELRRASDNFRRFNDLTSGRNEEKSEAKAALNVYEAVKVAKKAVDPLARLKGRAIEIDCDPVVAKGGQTVSVRKSSLADMIENLLHNAVKYSIGVRQVCVDIRDGEHFIEILVTNFGCEIPEEESKKVFELEFRSEEARQLEVEGTGIGLWIVDRLAAEEGAEVMLVSCTYFSTLERRPGQKPAKQFKVIFSLKLPKG